MGRDLDARLALAAGLAELGRTAGIRPVVVGGTAVDFYAASTTARGELLPSRRLQASQDVDIITVAGAGSDAAGLRKLLAASPEFYADTPAIPVAGRRKWWLRDAPMLVEVLGDELYGDPERVVTLEIDGSEAYLWAPEDTVWQYAQLALSERSRTSWERARAIAAAQALLDWDYLRTRADTLAPVGIVEALRDEDSFDAMMERMA